MVLNLMTLNILPFLPGRRCKKKGLPLLATASSATTIKNMGDSIMNTVSAADCDLFGRMRTELMMARISDGIPHFFEGRRPGDDTNGARTGGAALEYRLIHLDWPRAGDRVELRSGASGGDARFRRLTHWLLDPDSGRAWGVAEEEFPSTI